MKGNQIIQYAVKCVYKREKAERIIIKIIMEKKINVCNVNINI